MRKLLLLTTAATLLFCASPAYAGPNDFLACRNYYDWIEMANITVRYGVRAAQGYGLRSCTVVDGDEPWVAERFASAHIHAMGELQSTCIRRPYDTTCLWTMMTYKDEEPKQAPRKPVIQPQAPTSELPTAPATLPPGELGPLHKRIEEINKLARQSLPIITRHCGTDALCRKQQTAAMYAIASKEIANAIALRNPTTYADAVLNNDILNSCVVMWGNSEDFAATMQCINDAAPTM
jgi:hypothetical protein